MALITSLAQPYETVWRKRQKMLGGHLHIRGRERRGQGSRAGEERRETRSTRDRHRAEGGLAPGVVGRSTQQSARLAH